jgi:DNA polymerase-1
MGVNALRQNLGTDRAEAQRFYDEYFKKFSGLASYLDAVKKEVHKKGYTETLFGRRRYFEGLDSKLPYVRAASERIINALIQGTEADIIKLAISGWTTSEKNVFAADVSFQVHTTGFEIKDDLVSVALTSK